MNLCGGRLQQIGEAKYVIDVSVNALMPALGDVSATLASIGASGTSGDPSEFERKTFWIWGLFHRLLVTFQSFVEFSFQI